jgi:hypothetical protein
VWWAPTACSTPASGASFYVSAMPRDGCQASGLLVQQHLQPPPGLHLQTSPLSPCLTAGSSHNARSSSFLSWCEQEPPALVSSVGACLQLAACGCACGCNPSIHPMPRCMCRPDPPQRCLHGCSWCWHWRPLVPCLCWCHEGSLWAPSKWVLPTAKAVGYDGWLGSRQVHAGLARTSQVHAPCSRSMWGIAAYYDCPQHVCLPVMHAFGI